MKEYLTEEELALLIEQTERQEPYAPGYMKERILNQAFPKQTVKARPRPGGREASIKFFSYRLKIIAGMAAAVFMLAILPVQQNGREYGESIREREWTRRMQEETPKDRKAADINYVLNEGARRADHKLNAWFGKISDWQKESLFERDGGIYYED